MRDVRMEADAGPLNTIADGYYEVDLDGRFTAVNSALCELLGHSRDDLLGRSYTHFTCNDDQDCFDSAYPGQRFEWSLERDDGAPVIVEGTIAPIRNGEGSTVGFRGILRDITERKRQERSLAERAEALSLSRSDAVARTRTKSDFVANLSHEIRGPMNGIIGMTELALETDLSREQRGYLLAVRASATALLTLLNDILDLSKIEAGQLGLESIAFGLRDCLHDMLRPLQAKAGELGLELTGEVDPHVPDRLVGDPTRLRQVLANVVDDAIEAGCRGQLALRAAADTVDDKVAHLRFEIERRGVVRAERRPAQAPRGRAALGLAISRQLLELMGGCDWLETDGEDGAHTVSFLLPFPIHAPGKRRELERHENLKGLRVLIADGNPASRQMLVDGLRYFGLRTVAQATRESAWQALEATRDGTDPFDVVVVDGQLPDGDGFELARRIRDEGLQGTRVILLSRSGQRGDAAHCRDLGIAGYLSKPIGPLDLLDSIRAVIGVSSAAERACLVTRHALRESRPRLDVLVAETDAVHQLVLRTLLEKSGHRVTMVTDAEQLIEALTRQRFDVVLVDAAFAEIDGIGVSRIVRERQAGADRRPTVIVMTPDSNMTHRRAEPDPDVDECLDKPFEPGELFEALERCAKRRGCLGESPPSRAAGEEPILDRARLIEQTGGDPALLRQLVEIFLDEKAALLDGIRRAIESGDGPSLVRAAHRLRSTCGSLAARLAAEAAAQLERVGEIGELSQVPNLYSLLENRVRQLEQELVALIRPPQAGSPAGT